MECARDVEARIGAICALPVRGSSHLFAVAGGNPRGGNQIRVLEYLPSTSEILPASVVSCPGAGAVAYRCMAPAGGKAGIVAAVEDPLTSEADEDGGNVVLLRLPTLSAGEGGDEDGSEEAALVLRLPASGCFGEDSERRAAVRVVRWKPRLDDEDDEDDEDDHDGEDGGGSADGRPTGAGPGAPAEPAAAAEPQLLVTVAPGCVTVWRVTSGSDPAAEVLRSWRPPAGEAAASAAFDPTAACRVVVAAGGSIYVWDGAATEGTSPVLAARAAHDGARVLDVSCNPNRPWVVASAGEDGCVRVWDMRHCSADGSEAAEGGGASQLCLRGHSHWCGGVRFNPFHDQLLLSSGTDGAVCLWSAPSVSSAPLDPEASDDADGAGAGSRARPGKRAADAALRRWATHGDAVPASCLTWSAGSAWVVASASVEGHFAVREVPHEAKYKILLH
ncbi:hypothetical protein FNF27_05491 [Cafeteria roenbergensis]|uniref:EIPR1-like beta-propeller domain-containing protein n=1 Tax=Cafeteria roenbergensis TaxID=33653 RepID=A0A5A8DNC8_CAFRO|nr:hypothetical protein FNF31_01440 [Cafeteria roenbergensis]KAA0173000.1 hypothetical protein FNF27_05491 [Cafeteria roenbergensis]